MFTHANFAIYVLDDYTVHLMPEVRNTLWKRGCILVINGENCASKLHPLTPYSKE